MFLIDTDPDPVEASAVSFCKRCDCECLVVKRDCGIGRFEYWGSKEVHRDMRDCCGTCGDEL